MSRLQELLQSESNDHTSGSPPAMSALEYDFPAAAVSLTAEAESWRKEVHRPASHTHKWWAQRLGTVFRAVLIAAYSEKSADVLRRLNTGFELRDVRVLDPFAGSGTTLVEAQKLGATCTGVDINPVAGLVQRQALNSWDEQKLRCMMMELEAVCRGQIDSLHIDREGDPVLYYFWVAQARCTACSESVDLFSNYVLARHAYPRQHPIARAICPECGAIEQVDLRESTFGNCRNGHTMDVSAPVMRDRFTCRAGHVTRIIDALGGERPRYRMYAKLTLRDNIKTYEEIDDFDVELYERAACQLSATGSDYIVAPSGKLEDGYNTRQAIRWGFDSWDKFFNARQLYCLGILGAAIREYPDSPEREALCTLFSGTLEFNNLFCSYKGEGTGAVRHMFSHHILKPERTPLEAHPWGTNKSSGSFSTLFRSRILRAHEYKIDPHDIVIENGKPTRRRGLSRRLESIDSSWEVMTCDSAELPHSTASFDLIVTDPPYFNNVHYSELADFFHSWLRQLRPYPGYKSFLKTTRSSAEVQDTDATEFCTALARVFSEAARVLKPDGMIVFSFHHGTFDAWNAVTQALHDSGLTITSIQPVKAEMSTSSTKYSTREPNNLDSLVICRVLESGRIEQLCCPKTPQQAAHLAETRLMTLNEQGIRVGVGDVRSVVTGSVLALTTLPNTAYRTNEFRTTVGQIVEAACFRWSQQAVSA